jgi:Pyruvate/2-oxoacid:ferredoxin oxidoreductase delta subunit
MNSKDPYEALIVHMQHWLMGLPDNPEMRELLAARVSPEEAAFLARLPLLPHTLEELTNLLETPPEALQARLDPMARKGLVFRHESRHTIRYALNGSMFMLYRSPFWSGSDDDETRRLAQLSNKYFYPVYGHEFGDYPTTGLRAIPVQRTLEDPRRVSPYEDVVQVLDREDYFCVAHCPCRQRKNLDPDSESCRHETFNCLHFGRLARYMVQQDMGKEIGREETLEILGDAADAGLVHAVSTHLTKPDSICNCCSCCCIYVQSATVLGAHGHQRSNYVADVVAQTCKGCGLCAERCPMNAVDLQPSTEAENKKGMAAVVDGSRCIGCGVCAYKCPSQSIRLAPRPKKEVFPVTEREMAEQMAKERGIDVFGS